MRRRIRELMLAARRRGTERSQSPARSVIRKKPKAKPANRRETWLQSIQQFVTHQLHTPSTLNPYASFYIRRGGGAKAPGD